VSKIVKVLLYLIVLIAALDQLGVDTTSVIAVLGAAGIAVGFALQGTLSNFAAGVMIIIFRQIKVGDFVEGGGTMGTVAEIGMFHSKLTTPDNKAIYVPNSKMVGDNITNFTEHDIRRVDMVFGISYKDDIDKAKSIINEMLKNDERVLEDPEPMVVVGALGDSSVNFNVRPWTKKEDYWGFYWDMTENIKKKFDEAGISIPFPQRDVHLFQN
jgi:small conductance mechanosensitive channel